tara:strand:- start:3291 stop:3932 length:642 start_codon:yes stop_codon:yes gene_type:complete
MSYREGESMRLDEVKKFIINPVAILDIGAHSGQFYGWAKNMWPNSVIWMIEANHLHEQTLKNITQFTNDKYFMAALGDEEREVTFYTRKDKPHTEGNSYYKEANYWDVPHLIQESTVRLQKLDDLFDDDTVFEVIKMDTQGSELDILKGGKNLVSKASVIILEIAYTEYNIGAPTAEDVIKYMNEIGFIEKMSVGEHYDGDEIIQKDLLFLKN